MNTLNIKKVSNRRILAVDDDSIVGNLIQKVLNREGFDNVDIVVSAEKALVALDIPINSNFHQKETSYDLIILDVILPDINGFDLCSRIKSSLPHIPVMLISGYDISEIQSKVLQCGADDFMSKPFNTCELTTRVNLLLYKAQKTVNAETVFDESIIREGLPGEHEIPYIGDRIDNYVILDSIGLGKTSIIYKIIDVENHEILAMKMLTAHSKEFGEIVERFNYEINIMSKINHPNVIQYYAHGTHKHCTYLVMEYLDGVNLEELIIAKGRISELLLLNISLDLANGICEIHKNAIIHRDIKLKNSIYNPVSGQVKLCDFGIAQLPDTKHITQDGTIIGTPIYMAPESFRGSKANTLSDIYSYGATIYHLATNTPPYVAESNSDLYLQHMSSTPISIEAIRPEFSKRWSDLIINKCLSSDPDQRPHSMKEIIKRLQKIKKEISLRHE